MGDRQAISAKIERARQVERVLLWIGWLVAALATVLSGVTAYGAGVSIGIGAARLQLAARAVDAGQDKAS